MLLYYPRRCIVDEDKGVLGLEEGSGTRQKAVTEISEINHNSH